METNGDRGSTRKGSRIFRRRQLPPGLAVAAALLLSSCHLMTSYETGPEGRSMHDTDLRRLARDEAFTDALDLTDPDDRGEIGDELLRLMHRGLLLHYAGRYEESNEVLQRAEAIIDDRYTKSVSLALLSIVTNDRALAWFPRDTERLMVNYYGALNYLALGDPEEAAVEARRLSYLLELAEDEELEEAELVMHTMLRYFAGSVFEASGNRNDAAVSYRHVWSPDDSIDENPLRPRFLDLYGADWVEEEPVGPVRTIDTVADSILAARADTGRLSAAADSLEQTAELDLPEVPEDGASPAVLDEPDELPVPAVPDSLDSDLLPDSLLGPEAPPLEPGGDVVVLLERGFVAHRVERSRSIPLFPLEADALHDPNENVRFATAACVASRAFQGRHDFSEILAESGTNWRGSSGGKCIVPGASRSGKKAGDSGTNLFLMRVAWPEMVGSGLPTDLSVTGLAIAADAGPLQMAALDSVPNASISDSGGLDGRVMPVTDESAAGSPGLAPTFRRPTMRGSVSGAVREEFEDQIGTILIKTVARTALKYELARGLEKELDKKNELLGDIAFLTANAAAAMFERADTRSWHLLPDELSVVRLRLPPGNHPLTLEVETDSGGTRLIDLGEIDVRDGGVHVISARVWP